MNRELRSNETASLANFDYHIPYNSDNTLSFYWFDAHEENFGADIYLFGKVY